jgi:hypothetical protein
MIYNTFAKRNQIRWYDETRAPNKTIISTALANTYDIVASKQNLMPYKVYAVGPFNKDINQGLYNVSMFTGVKSNYNLLTAPYQFIYTVRLATGNAKVQKDLLGGHKQPPMDPECYKAYYSIKNTNIEIGMHATILSGLLIEAGLDVSYTLCFADFNVKKETWLDNGFDFIEDDVQFLMSAGYADLLKYKNSTEDKPTLAEVLTWVE